MFELVKKLLNVVGVSSSWGVMVKAMHGGIVVSEFELQSCYYVHFLINTLGRGINPLILPAMGLNSTTTVLLGRMALAFNDPRRLPINKETKSIKCYFSFCINKEYIILSKKKKICRS